MRLRLVCFVFWMVLLSPAAVGSEDILRFGRKLLLGEGESGGDAACFGCSISVRGTLTGDAVAIGGDVEVAGAVAGDVVALGGTVFLRPTARLQGNAVALGGPVVRDVGAGASGQIVSKPWFSLPGQRGPRPRGVVALAGFNLVLAAIFYLIARQRRIAHMATKLAQRPWRTLFIGIGALMALILLYGIAAFLGRVEDTADALIAAALFILFALGTTAIGYALGSRVMRGRAPFATILTGIGVVTLIEIIPLVGLLGLLLLTLWALGCAVLGGFGRLGGTATGENSVERSTAP